jgi:phosphoglucomutase
MSVHPLAGQAAPYDVLINVPRLISAYYSYQPDASDPVQRVAFGTSGHRGSSLNSSFNEAHILAISQAICELRLAQGIGGPLFLGMDTHALSEPALISAVEVFAAHGVEVVVQQGLGYTPTPVISHAILTHNRGRTNPPGLADGVVITPSHNPPEDGGFKYNPPPAGRPTPTSPGRSRTAPTSSWPRAEGASAASPSRPGTGGRHHPSGRLYPPLRGGPGRGDRHASHRRGRAEDRRGSHGRRGRGLLGPHRRALRAGSDVVNPRVDPTFAFMTLDHDGKIRMDCSSPYAMASLMRLKDHFDIAFGNDTDYDRHGIVTRSVGLMNPNHFLATAIWYLFQHRPDWRPDAAIGKTLVSSSMIDRVAMHLGRRLAEVPVGFKWFVEGLLDGSFGFGGEESAGASFLRRDGTVWTTDKDGFILDLLAAEILAVTGRDPGEHYQELESRFGQAWYARKDAPVSRAGKAILSSLSPQKVQAEALAGAPILHKLTQAPYNGAAIGGLKVVTANGWFAARPSGTEDVYKIYAESFVSPAHLEQIQAEAQAIVDAALE